MSVSDNYIRFFCVYFALFIKTFDKFYLVMFKDYKLIKIFFVPWMNLIQTKKFLIVSRPKQGMCWFKWFTLNKIRNGR